MAEWFVDTVLDSARLVPFLFVTYLAMEWIEHKTGNASKEMIRRSGRFGPVIGAVAGAFPQCGFSAAASGLYAGRIITLGTLVSIYLSTSDEMLPVLLSESVPLSVILKMIGIKVVIGFAAGFLIDALLRGSHKEHDPIQIKELCVHEHCHCEKGMLRSALSHTTQITFFIFAVTLLLNLIIDTVGEDALSALILNRRFLGEIIAGLVGLIPNCGASVIITQLYLNGAMSFGAMMSGLLVGAGIGLLVLFRVNLNVRENIRITGLLYIIGVASGIFLNLMGAGV